MALRILITGAAGKYDLSPLFNVCFENFGGRIGQNGWVRVDKSMVPRQIGRRGCRTQVYNVDRYMPMLQRPIPGGDTLALIRAMPRVQSAVPFVVIIPYDSHIGLIPRPNKRRTQPCNFRADCRNFRTPPVLLVMVVIYAMPVDLGPDGCGPPSEVQHHVRAVRDRLVRPQTDLAGARSRLLDPVYPSPRSGLLLHDAELRGDVSHNRKIVSPTTVQQRMLTLFMYQRGKMRIRVVREKVQVLVGQLMIIQVAEQAVGGNEMLFIMRSDRFGLDPREGDCGVRDKTLLVQGLMRVGGVGWSRAW